MGLRRWFLLGVVACAATLPLAADPADLKDLDKALFDTLGAKASNTVNITLDGALLKMGAGFLGNSDDADAAQIKRIVSGLRSISIRSFEFKHKGEYTDADVQAIRSRMDLGAWSRIVDVKNNSEGDNAEIYVLSGQDKIRGMFILCANPTQLTAIHILGTIDPKDVGALEKLGRESAHGDDQ